MRSFHKEMRVTDWHPIKTAILAHCSRRPCAIRLPATIRGGKQVIDIAISAVRKCDEYHFLLNSVRPGLWTRA